VRERWSHKSTTTTDRNCAKRLQNPMTKSDLTNAAVAASGVLAAATLSAADQQAIDDLIAKIKDKDDNVRTVAWQNAGSIGAPAVKALAGVMTDPDMEVARAAKRGLWKIVRHAGRPGADDERQAVSRQILALLEGQPTVVRREALWMLSEIGGKDAVKPIASLLSDRDVREDARAALERIPGSESVAALQSGLESAPEEFKPALAQSLRVRGVKVTGYPSQKLVPTRPASPTAPKTL
jgi:HEAT repeat protein